MKPMLVASGAVMLAGALTIGFATVAGADPLGGSAADVVQALQNQGYSVQFNMPSNMTLSRCTVNGVHGLPVAMPPAGSLTVMMVPASDAGNVYVDLVCPASDN